MKIFLPAALGADALAELGALRGAFRNGHDDRDARGVLGRIQTLTGIEFAVLWDYEDGSGPGGNSQLVLVDQCQRLREVPGEWTAFLYHPAAADEQAFPLETLFGLRAGNVLRYSRRAGQCSEYNFALRQGAAA
jgi:hypothetical protein